MPKWRNWQTRTFEGRVRQLVGVRVPPSAPNPFLKFWKFISLPRVNNRYVWDKREGHYFIEWWEGKRLAVS